ncbi:MAG: methylmalonyl Co-A mutase-associated GTPase MeaB, partial [Bacteroidales bacterium]|nr:methylmalonyl Co-A mutase-associated GTPase MeaB [Bacteroidales bacterium]
TSSAGTLGGVARKTRESLIVCEAAGFDTIIIETVGVGQSEVAVNSMVDFFLLLMLAGAGDELQGIKRGIMEMADAIVITKADGDNVVKSQLAKNEFANALRLFPLSESRWIPQAETCSALMKDGIDKVWNLIIEHNNFTKNNGYLEKKRKEQAKFRMYDMIDEKLKGKFYGNSEVSKIFPQVEAELLAGRISSYMAAQKLIDAYKLQ